MSKSAKRTLEHIELIQSDLAPMFEIKLLVVVDGYTSPDEGDLTAAEWLHNILHLAASGHDMQYAANEFHKAIISTSETRVHLCKVEQVQA
jgi:hypothetical protein